MGTKSPTKSKRNSLDDETNRQNALNNVQQKLVPSFKKKQIQEVENNGKSLPKTGQVVYVADRREAWKVGTVYDVVGEDIFVKLGESELRANSPSLRQLQQRHQFSSPVKKKKIKCKLSHIRLHCNVCLADFSNLTNLPHMNEATVLFCLHERYDEDKFYTNAGSMVIAVNPFKDVEYLYGLDKIEDYNSNNKSLPPHIYEIASKAYKQTVSGLNRKNQCIVVSGESGAGKTVSAKHLLKYITVVSNPESSQRNSDNSNQGGRIHDKILQSSPILEAFGNAATPRNGNSSRFGKFIELQFHRNGVIKGAAIQTYLLEKTRVVHPAETECNFHIFYQLTESVSEETGEEPGWLKEMRKQFVDHTFNILPHGQQARLNRNISDTLTAMTDIGLTSHHQTSVFEILYSIIFLGNISFTPTEEDSSELTHNDLSEKCACQRQCSQCLPKLAENSCVTYTVTMYAIEESCRLLGISSQLLEKTLLNRNITSGNRKATIFVKPVSIIEAKSRRDCLAMLLYSRLFDWLLTFINQQIQCEECSSTIGLLDIYGFETFETNSLEQLCINYANEKIQQHYIGHFLRDLQREYEEECIPWLHINYHDNQPCLNILEGSVCIFGILNEEVYLSRKTSVRDLADRLLKIKDGEHSPLKKPKTSVKTPSFVISHYAGNVCYSVEHMVTKNKDNIPAEIITLLSLSEKPFVRSLLTGCESDSHSQGKKKKTVLQKFKGSLDQLMMTLKSSDVHYIRCIKPNEMSEGGQFDRVYVMKQLEACGIVETVRICQQTYSSRMSYEDFHERYGFLLSYIGAQHCDTDKENQALFESLEMLLCKQLGMPVSPTLTTQIQKKKLRRRTGLAGADHIRKCCAAVLQSMFMSEFTDYERLVRQFGKTKIFLLQEQIEKLESCRAQVLNQQACVIQNWWRRLISLWMKRKQNEAAAVIQRAFLIYKLKKELKLKFETEKQQQKLTRIVTEADLSKEESPELVQNTTKPVVFKGECSELIRDSMTPVEFDNIHLELSPGAVVTKEILLEEPVEEPAVKRLKLACSSYSQLTNVSVGDGIVTRRKLPKQGFRFHTRPSVLQNAHVVPRKFVECSITDCLPESKEH